DRPLAQGSVYGKSALDDLGCGLNATDYLDERHEMRRGERGANDEALGVPAARPVLADQKTGGTGSEDGRRRGCGIEFAEDVAFERFALGRVLLNELGGGDGSIGIGMKLEAVLRRGIRSTEAPKRRPCRVNETAQCDLRLRCRVAGSDRKAPRQ